MEESLSPALRNKHVLLYMQDILSEYMEYMQARVAKLREYIVWNLDNLIDESDMEAEDSEMENFVQLLNSLYEIESLEDERNFELQMAGIMATLLGLEHTTLHPYTGYMVTERGENRLLSYDRIAEKFGHMAEQFFRFSVAELRYIHQCFELPQNFCFDGRWCTGAEGLCIMLYRSATGCRLIDMSEVFDLYPSVLSIIFNGMHVFLHGKFSYLVRSFENAYTSNYNWLLMMGDSLTQHGCPLPNCFGFLDGVHIPVSRPSRDQRSFYCGHHHVHCFKSLGIQLANGIMLAFGPYNGMANDSGQVRDLNLRGLLTRCCSFPGNEDFVLYADAGFGMARQIVTPYRRGANRTAQERQFNLEMSRYRITVEWGFGRVKTLWKILGNKTAMKTLKSPVAIYWFNSVFLTNVQACVRRGNQVTDYFGTEIPTLPQYLAM